MCEQVIAEQKVRTKGLCGELYITKNLSEPDASPSPIRSPREFPNCPASTGFYLLVMVIEVSSIGQRGPKYGPGDEMTELLGMR